MGDRKKIVVLDDDEIFTAMLEEMLGEYYDVVVGHTGLQGIALCLEGGVDAVVTDIGMPDLDGMQMLREFKKNRVLAAIPVLVLTATHFTRLSRTEVKRFPQVRGLFSKGESMSVMVEALNGVLQNG